MTYTQSIRFRSFAFYNGNLKRTMVSGRSEALLDKPLGLKQHFVSSWKYENNGRSLPIKNQR